MDCRPSSVRGLATLPEFETERLSLRRLTPEDAPFVAALYNEPSFLEHIGDRGVRNAADAQRFLREGPIAMYERLGFGLWHVSRRADGAGIGMCGLLKRDNLPDVDIGYAYFPPYWGQGYAFEAVAGTLRHAVGRFGLRRVLGVVSRGNTASIRVLEKAGMRFERMLAMDPSEREVCLYAIELSGA
jgi:[ribosomal protein S5]-alanine N-acetyltransferase